MSILSQDLPCISTLFFCDICGNGFTTESEATACFQNHNQRNIIAMSYEAALNDVDEDDFPKDKENGTAGVTRSGKRKVADNDEETDDENKKKGRKSHSPIWSKEKTDKLLELVQFNQDRLLDTRIKKLTVWKEIWEELQIIDENLTLDQVEKKWRNMVQSYKKFRENIESGSTRMKKPNFFDIVDEVIKKKKYSSSELSYSEPMTITNDRSLEEDTDMDKSSCLETRLNSEDLLDSFVCDQPESPNVKRDEKRSRKKESLTNSESVERSVQQLVETNAKAVRVDQMRLKFLETQSYRQNKFDKDVFDAIRERNLAIKRTSNVIEEFREMLKEHMKLVKEIDTRTKKMERFIDTHFKTNSK